MDLRLTSARFAVLGRIRHAVRASGSAAPHNHSDDSYLLHRLPGTAIHPTDATSYSSRYTPQIRSGVKR